MVDVTVITPSSQLAAVQAGGGQQTTALLSALNTGATLSGVIAGKDNAGNFLLRTDSGTFALRSSTPLTYNSDVVIQVASGGSSARILSVNGESFANYTAVEPATTDSVSPSLLANLSQETQSTLEALPTQTTPSINIEATVVSSTPQTNTSVSLPSQGSTVTVQIALPAAAVSNTSQSTSIPEELTITVAASSPPPTPTVITSVTTAYTPAVTPSVPISASPLPVNNTTVLANSNVTSLSDAPAPTTFITASAVQAAPSAANVTPQNTSSAQLLQYAAYSKQTSAPIATESSNDSLQQNVAEPSTPAQVAPQTLQAQVINTPSAVSPSNTIVLSTPAGTLTLQTNGPSPLNALPSGSTLTISIPTSTPAANIPTLPLSLPTLATGWQTLADIINVLGNSSADTSAELTNRLPQLGEPNFTATSFSLISALAEGNIRSILGDDAISALKQKGRNDLLQRLEGELSVLNTEPESAAPGRSNTSTWQPVFLPFMFQEEIQQARLYLKRDGGKDKDRGSKKSSDTRFLIEVDLSEMGTMQMDGLVQKETSSAAFDLVIRTHTPFSSDQQNAITQIYTNTAQITGFRGSLTFQVTQDFKVKPLEEIVTPSSGITI